MESEVRNSADHQLKRLEEGPGSFIWTRSLKVVRA